MRRPVHIVIKYTSCDTVVFHYIQFSKFHTHTTGMTHFLEYQEYFLWGEGGRWVKGGRCVGLTTLLPSCADCLEIWEPQPPGTLRVCPGLYRDSFTSLPLPEGPSQQETFQPSTLAVIICVVTLTALPHPLFSSLSLSLSYSLMGKSRRTP